MVRPLYSHANYVHQAIADQASAGRVASRAAVLEDETYGRGKTHENNVDLEALFWRDFADSAARHDREDWTAGTFAFHYGTEMHVTRYVRAFGVEFCASDLHRVFGIEKPVGDAERQAKNLASWAQLGEQLRPTLEMLAKHAQPAPALSEASTERRPPRIPPPYAAQRKGGGAKPKRATKDDLRQWFPTYEAASNDFRFDSVMAAAIAHFAPRTVTRKPLRDIIGEFDRTRTRGKPTASQIADLIRRSRTAN